MGAAVAGAPGGPLLRAEGLWLSFGPDPALRGAGLEVSAGEIVALRGPSGSGKSTMLYCLSGILVPDRGEIWFHGVRVDDASDAVRTRLRRERFGFVLQFGQLGPELTARENVALRLQLRGVNRARAFREADVWLDRLGVGELGGRWPGQLSGGQQQRVAVARALLGGPGVVFDAEPTGALDSENGEVVVGLLAQLVRQEGAAVVLVTHDEKVADVADRQVLLSDGRVVAGMGSSA
jgi:putative ABC transport system ATP-binding protein